MCVPLTVNGPPAGPLIVPGEMELSPQLTDAEYSAAVDAVSGSLKVAIVPLKVAPSVALMVVPAAEGVNSGGGMYWTKVCPGWLLPNGGLKEPLVSKRRTAT